MWLGDQKGSEIVKVVSPSGSAWTSILPPWAVTEDVHAPSGLDGPRQCDIGPIRFSNSPLQSLWSRQKSVPFSLNVEDPVHDVLDVIQALAITGPLLHDKNC